MGNLKKLLIKSVLLVVALLQLSSCGGSQDNSGATATTASKNLILLDTKSKSCTAEALDQTDQDLPAVYFKINSPKFEWEATKPNSLLIQYVRITLRSGNISGGQYICTLGNLDLAYAYWGNDYKNQSTTTRDNISTISAGSSLTFACGFRCGGIGFVDKKLDTSGSATIFVYATTVNSSNDEVPVTFDTQLQFLFQGVR